MAEERQRRDEAEDPIEERLAEGEERTEQDIRDTAEEAFVRDQREDPDHPANRRRTESGDTEDPVHSKGSEA